MNEMKELNEYAQFKLHVRNCLIFSFG